MIRKEELYRVTDSVVGNIEVVYSAERKRMEFSVDGYFKGAIDVMDNNNVASLSNALSQLTVALEEDK